MVWWQVQQPGQRDHTAQDPPPTATTDGVRTKGAIATPPEVVRRQPASDSAPPTIKHDDQKQALALMSLILTVSGCRAGHHR